MRRVRTPARGLIETEARREPLHPPFPAPPALPLIAPREPARLVSGEILGVMNWRLNRSWIAVKLSLFASAASLFIVGCGGMTASSATLAPGQQSAVAASCIGASPAQQFAMARVVFVGRMLAGPSTSVDHRHVLGSPAVVRVLAYLKGRGPRTVRVRTAARITANGVTVAEDGIEPQVGEIWKVFTDSRDQPFDTSICGGSGRVTSAGRVALDLWMAFPVEGRPRPIVALGEGVVVGPRTGFPDAATKIAFEEGRFTLGTALPRRSRTAGPVHTLSAAGAYRLLRVAGRSSGIQVAPLVIRSVRLGAARFLTDRGPQRLPAWQFSFKRVAKPASVLALAPPDVFKPPVLQQLGPTGPGNSIEDSARANRAGTSITISFVGAPPGNGPCDARYLANAVADRRAVAFTITAISPPASPNTICTAIGYLRTVVLHLSTPLGKRALISSSDAGAIPITR